jgi:hypothetical protein
MRMDRGRPAQQVDGFYDSFAVCPRGSYGHPSIDQGPREAREGWYERAVEALTFPDTRFEMLARRVDQLFRW